MVLSKFGQTDCLVGLEIFREAKPARMQKIPCRFCACGKNDENKLICASRRLCRSLLLRVPDLPADAETLCSGCNERARLGNWAPCPDEARAYRDDKAGCSRGGQELEADVLPAAWCCQADGRGIDRRYTACRLCSNTVRPIVLCELPDAGVADRRRRRHRSIHR